MPHTTRRNYKSKLEERCAPLTDTGLRGVETADAIYEVFEKENIAKQSLYSDIQDLGEMAIDILKKLDSRRVIGGLKFASCEETNDDHIRVYDAHRIIDRVFDILMTAEERIELLSDQLSDAFDSQIGLHKRLGTLGQALKTVQEKQLEVYYVGENATEEEAAAFHIAELNGSKFVRTIKGPKSLTPVQIPSDKPIERATQSPVSTKVVNPKQKPASRSAAA